MIYNFDFSGITKFQRLLNLFTFCFFSSFENVFSDSILSFSQLKTKQQLNSLYSDSFMRCALLEKFR
jgi:hypothetical protein